MSAFSNNRAEFAKCRHLATPCDFTMQFFSRHNLMRGAKNTNYITESLIMYQSSYVILFFKCMIIYIEGTV